MGAYGGRAEIMDHVLPAGKVFQAGTLSGNPLATAAGIATLKMLARPRSPMPRWSGSPARLVERAAASGAGGRHCRTTVDRVRLDVDALLQPAAGARLAHAPPAATRPATPAGSGG